MKSSLEYQFLLQDPEEEYMKFKKKLYKKVFYIILGLFLAAWLAELYQTLTNFRYQPYIEFSLGIIIVTAYIMSSKKYQEGIITVFFVYAYLTSVYRNYSTRCDIIFANSFDSFYFSYGLAALEAIIATRIPSLQWKLFFVLASSFGRMLIVPFNRKGLFVIQMVFLGLKIYFDVDREKHERNLYRLYFNYKQQLGKFKNLIVNDVSQAIAIISPNLSSCLFTNSTFQELLKHSSSNIETLFQQFLVQKDTNSGKLSSTRSLKGSKAANFSQNLLGFLKENFFDQGNSPQKMSCILQYTTSSNSTKRVFSAVLMSIMWDDEPCIAVMLRDITEQNTILSLRIADSHKDMMIATVSHELRTPLNGMLGMLKILQRRVQDVELQGFLCICQNSGSLLLSLVNSILDLNQIKAKKLKLNMEKVEIWEILKGVLALFEFQFKMKKVDFVVESMEPMKSWIVTDKNRLNQILINLVGNALKFTSKGGVRVIANTENNGKYLRFEVKDTGTGIKEEDKGKLFRMFGRLDDDNEMNNQGVGLGLTISDSLARVLCDDEEIKGIKVESRYKEGSTFSFVIDTGCEGEEGSKERIETIGDELGMSEEDKKTLEVYQMKPKMKSSIKVELKSSSLPVYKLKGFSSLPTTPRKDWITREKVPFSATSSKFKQAVSRRMQWILLVDDNLFNIAVGKQFIESLGYGVKSAYSGEEAIIIMENNRDDLEKIDLILMDCQMPGIGGYEATRILREKMEKKEIGEIPIVALTANDSEMNKQACLEAGMMDYLSKPLKEDELLNITKRYIVRR